MSDIRRWPRTVTLCGSIRHFALMLDAAGRLTAEGRIVHLPLPADADSALLAEVQRAKIRAADEIVVVTVDGYIGPSAAQEVEYVQRLGKPVSHFSKPEAGHVLTEQEVAAINGMNAAYHQRIVEQQNPPSGFTAGTAAETRDPHRDGRVDDQPGPAKPA